jgi:hypothetical protein
MNVHVGTGPQTSLRHGRRRWTVLGALLAGGLLVAPAATWALPARLPTAAQEVTGAATGSGQVIAQGITRLPKGNLVWTIQRVDIPGQEGTAVDTFPIGFALADGASVAILDDAGNVLDILDDGEAAFLPNGKSGAVAAWQSDSASFYAVALVSADDVASGAASGTAVGQPFPAPNGRAFEIELARSTLGSGDAVTIPVSRSSTPTLFLQTAGASELTPAGGQAVELTAGQYALLLDEVVVRGSGEQPAAFAVVAIGDATGNRGAGAAGTPKAGRGERQRTRAGGGGQGGAAVAKPAKQKKAKRQRTGGGRQANAGGGGGQAQQQQSGAAPGTPVPGGEPTPAVGTPAPIPLPRETVPASPIVPTEGMPAPAASPEATSETDENVVIQDNQVGKDVDETPTPTPTPVEQAPTEEALPQEGVVAGEAVPTEATTPAEEVMPPQEAPAEEAPPTEAAAEAPAAEAPTEAGPVEPAPVEQAPVEGEPTVDPNATGG